MDGKKHKIMCSGQENYLVLSPERDGISLFELEYLCRRKISGCMPYEIMIQNGKMEFWYRLTGCNSLETMLEIKAFGEEELRNLFRGIFRFCKELERNLLNPSGILLDLESVFFQGDNQKVLFCYNPEKQEALKFGMLSLLEEMLTLIDYKNQNMVELLYQAYEGFNQSNADYSVLEKLCEEKPINKTEAPLREENIEEDDDSKEEMVWGEEKTLTGSTAKGAEGKLWMDKVVQKLQTLSFRELAKKKAKRYLEFKPVIIQPTQGELDNKTVLLGNDITEAEREEGQSIQYCLRPEEDDEKRESIVLQKDMFVLGKNREKVDGVIEGKSVSRVHAYIMKEEGSYYLEDLNSLNGTYLNGERLGYKEKACLKENDIISIGGKSFCFGPL